MFKGSIVAIITPFKNGGVDFDALKHMVDWHVDQGTEGIVPCGTTGESPTLSHEEHMAVVDLVVKQADGRVKVIAGAGSNNTIEAIEFTKHAKAAGADATLHVAGYYNRPSQEGLYQHFKAVAEAADLPVIIYNIPPRAIVDISVETMARLAEIPNIVGVKDATTDLARPSRERGAIGPDWIMLSGEDGTALGYNAHGGRGCISVTANVAPRQCAEFQKACTDGDYALALELHQKLMPLHVALFLEPSPAGAKYGASLLNLCSDQARLPVMPLSDGAKAEVRGAMQGLGLI